MELGHGYGSTQHPSKGADSAMNKDETVDSAKYLKCSSSLSSSSSTTYESPMQSISPVQVPDMQVMERPGDVTCDRIPASVFDSKPSTPTGWSGASNESLFSIQIGNHSFSRDQFLTMDEDKFDELFKSGELRKSAELVRSRLHPSSSFGKQHKKKKSDLGMIYEVSEVEDETFNDSPNEKFDHLKCGVPQVEGSENSSTNNQQSDEGQPLAFPKKKKRSGWRLWPCSNYGWDFCLFTWSSFWCKWPSWKSCCCTWPSCCCCEWPRCGCNWPSCACKWPICGCNWPSCGCDWPGCGCIWPCCGCNWPGCRCCKWPSCSCCKWPLMLHVSMSKLQLPLVKF